jgi:CMP/dCMP kinase
MVVAIDGPAASGKTSVGRLVAAQLGLPFVDSGLLYRAIAVFATHEGVANEDSEGLGALAQRAQIYIDGDFVSVDGIDFSASIQHPDINRNLAAISATPQVRAQINPKLRAMAGSGVVMAGRDIGPVVFPETPFKFYITASLEERMRRRSADFASRGQVLTPEALRAEIAGRDRIDTGPDVAAEIISTDSFTQAQVAAHILTAIAAINAPGLP